jgi:hypothetical protein
MEARIGWSRLDRCIKKFVKPWQEGIISMCMWNGNIKPISEKQDVKHVK